MAMASLIAMSIINISVTSTKRKRYLPGSWLQLPGRPTITMQKKQHSSHLIFGFLMATLLALPILGLLAGPAAGEDVHDKEQLQPCWKSGLVEGAISASNTLNTYTIHTQIHGNTALLTGIVSNAIERALAGQIALSVAGIDSVNNKLIIDAQQAQRIEPKPSENVLVTDAMLTTKVKSQLLANGATNGLYIDVSTKGQVVTLTGEAHKNSEKELAYYIARNTGGVDQVVNRIQVNQ